ncbi:DEKNAAC101338 [Brettanomyces naardenensis]|uniref:DEKNAAC101338 n=1 Tax=Brettanomyces naardenensis TaxID=13370 RepID=A0A448YHK4_BRENA|nr:DEKNAAC101338 [Brettanomyces naardenensis]
MTTSLWLDQRLTGKLLGTASVKDSPITPVMSPIKVNKLLAKRSQGILQEGAVTGTGAGSKSEQPMRNGALFKTSVIRHKQQESERSVRKQLSDQDLQDIFAGLTISKQRALSNELSTVHEIDMNGIGEDDIGVSNGQHYATLTEENIQKFNDRDVKEDQETFKKSMFLKKFAEPEDADEEDFEADREGEEDDDFDSRVHQTLIADAAELVENSPEKRKRSGNPFLSMPVSKYTIKANRQIPTSESFHSLSSSASSTGKSALTTASATSFTETDTEQSDYADDYEDNDFDKVDLMNKLRQRQREAEVEANTVKQERKRMFEKMQSSIKGQRSQHFVHGRDYIEKGQTPIMDDFEDFDEVDTGRLRRFKVVGPAGRSGTSGLDRKRSMPVLLRSGNTKNNVAGSPKRTVRKYSSTLDLPSQIPSRYHDTSGSRYPPVSLSLKARPYYNGTELDDIDDLSTDDLTITLSDYKKLKRKSQRIDLTKYAEATPINHGRRHRLITGYADLTNTARLNKEGKLKIIRSMGKHKAKQVLPGHLYGEIVYDPDQMKWCGNEEELTRFEAASKPSLIKHSKSHVQLKKLKQPQRQQQVQEQKLITRPSMEFDDGETPQIVGNMVYDNKNLRWVSVTGKYEDDPFENMDDTITSDKLGPLEGYQRNQEGHGNLRIITGGSSRLTSSTSSSSISNYARQVEEGDYFHISPESYKAWKCEESRWLRKVRNWFPGEDDDLSFCYELKAFLNDQ